MQIGDKVKFVNETLEGVITRLIDSKTVGVSIEDGFEIPVLKNELIITSPLNAVEQYDKKEVPSHSKIAIGESEISIWFEQSSQTWYRANVLNNSNSDLLLSVCVKQGKFFKPLFAGRVEKRTTYLFNTLNLVELDQWGTYSFRIIFHEQEAEVPRAPWYVEYTFKSKDFMHPKDVGGKKAYLIPLKSGKSEASPITVDSLSFEPKPQEDKIELSRPEEVVDIHIHQLTKDYSNISAEEAITIQMTHFRNLFEKALALNYQRITFIHGVGNGTLKQRIWKEISGHSQVKTYFEAQKEKFGYGATEIVFK